MRKKFKASLGCIGNVKPAWATETLLQNKHASINKNPKGLSGHKQGVYWAFLLIVADVYVPGVYSTFSLKHQVIVEGQENTKLGEN